MIVDLDGYQLNQQPFIVKEIGLHSLQHGSFSWFLENINLKQERYALKNLQRPV